MYFFSEYATLNSLTLRIYPLFLPLLLLIVVISGCSVYSSEQNTETVYGQIGSLEWHGSPAVDGLGMLFVINDETTFGVPGTREDYSSYFGDELSKIEITADYKLTGEQTVRGWGATYPEIEFLSIKVAD